MRYAIDLFVGGVIYGGKREPPLSFVVYDSGEEGDLFFSKVFLLISVV